MSFVLFLIVAVATFSLSVKVVEASFWTGFFTVLAGVITVGLVILTGGSALAFLGLCPVCGVITSFGGLSALTITSGVACAEGLICGGTEENRFVVVPTEQTSACATDATVRLYNTAVGSADPDDRVAVYRFARDKNAVNPTPLFRDFALMTWITGKDADDLHGQIGRGFLNESTTWHYGDEFYRVDDGAYANYHSPGAGMTPWRMFRYGDICSENGACTILDRSAQENSYIAYAAKLLKRYDNTVRAQVARYQIVTSGPRAPYLRYNDGEIPLTRSGGRYVFARQGKEFGGVSYIEIPDGALLGFPIRYPVVNGRAQYNGGELPASFSCNGTAYRAEANALTVPLGALRSCDVVEYRVTDNLRNRPRGLTRAQEAVLIEYPYITWNDGIVRVEALPYGVLGRLAYRLTKGSVSVDSDPSGNSEVFRLPEFFMDRGAVQYTQTSDSLRTYNAYNNGVVVFPFPSDLSYIINDENPVRVSIENDFFSRAAGVPATLPQFDRSAYDACRDSDIENPDVACVSMAGAWYAAGTIFAGPYDVAEPSAEACAVPTSPVAVATVADRGCNFVALAVNAANADTYDVLRDGATVEQNIPAAQHEFNDSGLAAATRYVYSIIARRGAEEGRSSDVGVLTPACANQPAASVELRDAQCTSIDLGVIARNASSYDVLRNGVVIAAGIDASVGRYRDEGLTDNTTYDYIARVHEGSESADSSVLRAATLNCSTPDPSVVVALGSGGAACDAVNLSVDAQNADTYDVLRNGVAIASGISAATHAYQDTTVAELSSYSYAVSAHRASDGRSGTSVPLAVQTPACPRPSANVSIGSATCNAVALNVAVTGGNTYDVLRNGAVIARDRQVAQMVFNDSGLVRSRDYQYAVVARNERGLEATSNSVTAHTICLPRCTFGATPEQIVRGESAIIGWSCERVDACTLDSSVAAIPNGTRVVAPRVTTEYVLRCSNADGSTTTRATVNVVQPGLREVPP